MAKQTFIPNTIYYISYVLFTINIFFSKTQELKERTVTVHSYLVPVTDFADASHSRSAKSATTTVSYGIFSSENACL